MTCLQQSQSYINERCIVLFVKPDELFRFLFISTIQNQNGCLRKTGSLYGFQRCEVLLLLSMHSRIILPAKRCIYHHNNMRGIVYSKRIKSNLFL